MNGASNLRSDTASRKAPMTLSSIVFLAFAIDEFFETALLFRRRRIQCLELQEHVRMHNQGGHHWITSSIEVNFHGFETAEYQIPADWRTSCVNRCSSALSELPDPIKDLANQRTHAFS